MNRDDITRMAREAGAGEPESLFGRTDYIVMTRHELERFAALVAEAERKRIESRPWGAGKEWIERAVAAEREACAKLCESFSSYEAHDCAAAIRARGEK